MLEPHGIPSMAWYSKCFHNPCITEEETKAQRSKADKRKEKETLREGDQGVEEVGREELSVRRGEHVHGTSTLGPPGSFKASAAWAAPATGEQFRCRVSESSPGDSHGRPRWGSTVSNALKTRKISG